MAHQPMPVTGYTVQSQSNVELANEGNELEERYLRWLDKLGQNPQANGEQLRWIKAARTHIQTGAMCAVRAIFQPLRIKLAGDP